jgi:hypothetical protein
MPTRRLQEERATPFAMGASSALRLIDRVGQKEVRFIELSFGSYCNIQNSFHFAYHAVKIDPSPSPEGSITFKGRDGVISETTKLQTYLCACGREDGCFKRVVQSWTGGGDDGHAVVVANVEGTVCSWGIETSRV